MAIRQLADGLETLDAPVIPSSKEALDGRAVGDDDDVFGTIRTIKATVQSIKEQCHAVIDIRA